MEDFRVIIAGSRNFNDYKSLCNICDFMLQNKIHTHKITILCGGARGADELGKCYGNSRGFTVELHPARWNDYGKKAGYLRNEEMARQADALIAFWDGKSKGTAHMIAIAERYKLLKYVYNYD